MRGMHRNRGRHSKGGPRFELVVLVVSLALVISQSLGMIAASAIGPGSFSAWGWHSQASSTSKDAASVTSKDAASVTHEASGGASQVTQTSATTGRSRSSSTAVALAPTPIVPNQIDFFQGLIAGGNPANEGDWTSGNLCQGNGPCYHELDNVPHRIGFNGLTPGTEYSITVLIDSKDQAGHPGYDNINSVVGFSNIPGGVAVTQNPDTTCGQSTTCMSYTFTFTPTAGTAQIRFNAHLAIGAHLFGGSSLSARIEGSSKNVPLPVGAILLDIRAHKFNDVNGNGTQDQGEPNLAGWTMTLYSGTTCSGNAINVTG